MIKMMLINIYLFNFWSYHNALNYSFAFDCYYFFAVVCLCPVVCNTYIATCSISGLVLVPCGPSC